MVVMGAYRQRWPLSIIGVALCVLLITVCAVSPPVVRLIVGRFGTPSPNGDIPSDWRPFVFKSISRHTEYRLVTTPAGVFLRARSDSAASALIRTVNIDPNRFRFLTWSWKPDRAIAKADLTTKKGDDSPARLYVLFDRHKSDAGLNKSHTTFPAEVLCYVWANQVMVGKMLPNAYVGRVKMIVVQSGPPTPGKWHRYRRDVAADYVNVFGRPPNRCAHRRTCHHDRFRRHERAYRYLL
jgi:hypothetical protein